MATNNSNYTYSDLVRLNDERAITLIPAMLVFSLYMLIGLIGNSLVCYIMGFRFQMNNQNFLIICLAIYDLLSCLVAIPTDIVRVRYSYMFPSATACKILRVIMVFTILNSTFVLTIIGIDRYKRICKPLSVQISRQKLKKILAFVTILASSLSWPPAVIFDLRSFDSPVPGQKAHDCSTSDSFKNTIFPKLYTISLIMTFLVLSACLITVYSIINITVRRHNRRQKENAKDGISPCNQGEIIKTPGLLINNKEGKLSSDMNVSFDNVSYNLSMEDISKSNNLEDTHNDVYPCRIQLTDDNDLKNKDFAKEYKDNNVECDKEDRPETKENILTSESKDESHQKNPSCAASSSSLSTALTPASSMILLEVPIITNSLKKSNSKSINFQDKECRNENDKVVQETAFSTSTEMSTSNWNNTVGSKITGKDKKRSSVVRKAKGKKSTSEKMETKTTQIAFLVTLVFILSFLPYLVLRILEDVYEGFDYNLQGAPLVFHSIFLRSYFINSISNPIIYSVLNIRFRSEVKHIVRKIFRSSEK